MQCDRPPSGWRCSIGVGGGEYSVPPPFSLVRVAGLTCCAYGYFSGGRSRSAAASTDDRAYTGCWPAYRIGGFKVWSETQKFPPLDRRTMRWSPCFPCMPPPLVRARTQRLVSPLQQQRCLGAVWLYIYRAPLPGGAVSSKLVGFGFLRNQLDSASRLFSYGFMSGRTASDPKRAPPACSLAGIVAQWGVMGVRARGGPHPGGDPAGLARFLSILTVVITVTRWGGSRHSKPGEPLQ